jgi:hypothetical protein
MPAGTPVSRQWILVLHNGVIVIDWGDGLFQDVDTGDFLELTAGAGSYTAQDIDLEGLKRSSRVDYYDAQQAWILGLPERPIHTLE